MARLTHDDWSRARAVWEADPREGYAWLVRERNMDVSDKGVRGMSRRQGWTKKPELFGTMANVPPPPKTPRTDNNHVFKIEKKPIDKHVPGPLLDEPDVPDDVTEEVNTEGSADSKPLGRRPLYDKDQHPYRAYRLCLIGYTNEQIAQAFGVNPITIYRWQDRYPEFRDALVTGKEKVDADIAESLYLRAKGYSCPDTSVNVVNGEIVLTEVTKHYPPDTGAASLWLRNRQPHLWKERVEVQEDINLNIFPPREALDAIYEQALAKAAERAAMLTGRRERLGILIEHDASGDDGD